MTDLDEIQKRLKSMADVVNAFKSEAVQLRVMEVLLGQLDVVPVANTTDTSSGAGNGSGVRTSRRKGSGRRRPKAAPEQPSSGGTTTKNAKSTKKNRSSGSPGGFAMVSQLLDDGFFRKAQTIGSITSHCSTSKGHHYKANEISPGLLRLIRNGTLKRAKNKDGQYEYTQA